MGWALAIVAYTLAAEEATAVTDPGLIGVGTRVMPMGRLVLRLTNTMYYYLKTCLERECSLRLASLLALVLVKK